MIEKYYKKSFDALERMRETIEITNTKCNDLIPTDVAKLQVLNKKLMMYEKHMATEAKEQVARIKEKIADRDNLINGFECEVEISFFIGKYDPDYEENEDNIIITMTNTILDDNWEWGLDDGLNHGMEGWDAPVHNFFQCSTFHGLYDHTQLDWNEILRIEDIEFSVTTKACHDIV
ncbi:MAG: hypothetical protein KAJ49_04445 [Arcobacteraceae bacterium]|nr:hypothetical protein [Arcobacteraceae bacterium]